MCSAQTAADCGKLTQTSGFAGSPKWSATVRRIGGLPISAQESWESRKGSSTETSVSQIISVDVESGDRKATHQWTWHEGVTTVAERGSCRVREEQGSDPGLESSTSGEKGARGEFSQFRLGPGWNTPSWYHRELQAERHWMTPTFSRDREFDLMLTEAVSGISPTATTDCQCKATWAVASLCFEESSLELMNADGRGRKTIFYDAGKNAFRREVVAG